jgi:hypothetical protein
MNTQLEGVSTTQLYFIRGTLECGDPKPGFKETLEIEIMDRAIKKLHGEVHYLRALANRKRR